MCEISRCDRLRLIARRSRTCLSLRILKIDVRLPFHKHSQVGLAHSSCPIADIASTSPSNSAGFMPSSFSSVNSAITDYEVEVVEIRVKEGELKDIIP